METRTASPPAPARIAVLFERGRNGAAALARASEDATAAGAELTVVVLTPQATPPRCCGPSPQAYNCAIVDAATAELRDAARLVDAPAQTTRYRLLVEGVDPPLEKWVALGGFDLVIVPARRRLFGAGGHPTLRRLRRLRNTQACVVTAPVRHRGAGRPVPESSSA